MKTRSRDYSKDVLHREFEVAAEDIDGVTVQLLKELPGLGTTQSLGLSEKVAIKRGTTA